MKALIRLRYADLIAYGLTVVNELDNNEPKTYTKAIVNQHAS